MALLLAGIAASQQAASNNKPHVLAFNTARSAANDDLLELWNGSTSAAIKAAIDKDGKYYSAAWTAGDLPYVVAGGISNVKRMDTLAIGAAGKILRSDGSVPTWTTATFPDGATQGDLLYASAANTWGVLAVGASGRWLGSSGTAPQWNAPAALTKADDTNVTLTLGGSASTALLNAASITAGWTGQLGVTRGGTGLSTFTAAGGIPYATAATTLGVLAIGAANRVLTSTGSAPQWSASLTVDTSGNAASATLAASATKLATARTINGTSFDGTANVTVTAAAGTLTGTTLAATVVASSLTSVGSLNGLTIAAGQTLTVTGVTVTGLGAGSVAAGTFPAGNFSFQASVYNAYSGGAATVTFGSVDNTGLYLTDADTMGLTNQGNAMLEVDASVTAGHTRLQVYDVNAAALQRVKVGANGTGPGGSGRALYLDNV